MELSAQPPALFLCSFSDFWMYPGHRRVPGLLAVWERFVQGGGVNRLLQHVHQHLHPDSDEYGQIRGRLPPCQSPGHEDSSQGQGKSISFQSEIFTFSEPSHLLYSPWNHQIRCQQALQLTSDTFVMGCHVINPLKWRCVCCCHVANW